MVAIMTRFDKLGYFKRVLARETFWAFIRRVGLYSWRTIFLLQEQAELSKTMPVFWKKKKTHRVLKYIKTIYELTNMKQMVIGKKEWFGIVISGTHPKSNGIESVLSN